MVRFGPNSLSINTNTALKPIYGHKSNVKKSQFYSVFPPTKDTFNTHSSIDKASHARKRRVLSHAFSDNAIKSMEKYIMANVRTFTSALGAKPKLLSEKPSPGEWSVAQNMADWCNYLTFDVMGDLVCIFHLNARNRSWEPVSSWSYVEIYSNCMISASGRLSRCWKEMKTGT